ncbi:unnamed protein product [Amoebophrya sp. A25]|nr:unnamed protein product [Amoebophrya sp. A25]|eukprot:GSA25T00016861001.1
MAPKTRRTAAPTDESSSRAKTPPDQIITDPEIAQPIFDLIRSGTLLEELDRVDVGVLPRVRDVFQNSVILAAAENKHTDLVAFFLGKQVSDVAEQSAATGNTALHLATMTGNLACVDLLLGRKADVNTGNNVGWTPVFLAVAHNQPAILQSLITAKADVLEIQDEDGNFPLHLASQYNNLDITATLVKAQADPDRKNLNGLSALDNAQEHEICKAYMREILRQNEAFVQAARDSDTQKIQDLLEERPELARNETKIDGMSALEWAVMNGHHEGIQELVSTGAYCNIDDLEKFLKVNVDDNATQDVVVDALGWGEGLTRALSHADWDEATTLLDRSACVIHCQPFTGRTPLHLAVMQEEEPPYELLNLILTRKANLLARDAQGWTPLLHAVSEGHYTSAACLLKNCTKQSAPQILMPNFNLVSPISTAILRDDVVFLRIFADFVITHEDAFPKMELAGWADLAGDGGRPGSIFIIFHCMSFLQRLEVKMIQPYALKCVSNSLQRASRKKEHYATAQAILEAKAPVEVFEAINWDRVFAQAPEKCKEPLDFELEVATREAKNKGAAAKAKGKAKAAPGGTAAPTAATATTSASSPPKKVGADKERRNSLEKKKKASDEDKKEDIMLAHFQSMQRLKSNSIPTICKIDAEHFKLTKKEQTSMLMSPKILTKMSIELLLERKADPNAPDVTGQTPLHFHALRTGPAAAEVVRSLLAYDAECAIKDIAGKRAIDVATDPGVKQILRIAQISKLKLFEYENKGVSYRQLRIEGLPQNREPSFLSDRLDDLFAKYDLTDEIVDITIPVGSIDSKPFGYAIVRLVEDTPTDRFYEIHGALNGVMLYLEKTMQYKTRDKLLQDLTFNNDMTLSAVAPNGPAAQNHVAPGWKLVLLNGREVGKGPLPAIMAELMQMKEKQKCSVEVRNMKSLGRLQLFVESHFE